MRRERETHWPNDGALAKWDVRRVERSASKRASLLRYGAATLSVVAALIHAWVMPEHFREWWGYGTFFLIIALAQWFYSVVLLRWPRQPLFLLGIAGNLAIIGLYIATRTVGIPFFGPQAGEVEAIGVVDLISKVAELALVIMLVSLMSIGGSPRLRWQRQSQRRTPRLYGS